MGIRLVSLTSKRRPRDPNKLKADVILDFTSSPKSIILRLKLFYLINISD